MDQNTHGSYTIEFYDDIVMIRFIGSLDIELFEQFSAEIAAIGRSFKGGKWAEIHDCTLWELDPPEVIKRAREIESNPDKIRYRCTDQAIITASALTKIVTEKSSKNPEFITPHFVHTEEEAFSVLNGLGYSGKMGIRTDKD